MRPLISLGRFLLFIGLVGFVQYPLRLCLQFRQFFSFIFSHLSFFAVGAGCLCFEMPQNSCVF